VEQEIDKERPGDVVAILPGIGEAETADVAARHDVDEQSDAEVNVAIVAETWYFGPGVEQKLVGKRPDFCTRDGKSEEDVKQVGQHHSTDIDDLHAEYDDHEVPEKTLKICGREGEFIDSSLPSEQVVEHISCRDDEVGKAYQRYGCDEATEVVNLVHLEVKRIIRKHTKEVVEHDGHASGGQHEQSRTRIELAVDGEVPARYVEETMEIKGFHLIYDLTIYDLLFIYDLAIS